MTLAITSPLCYSYLFFEHVAYVLICGLDVGRYAHTLFCLTIDLNFHLISRFGNCSLCTHAPRNSSYSAYIQSGISKCDTHSLYAFASPQVSRREKSVYSCPILILCQSSCQRSADSSLSMESEKLLERTRLTSTFCRKDFATVAATMHAVSCCCSLRPRSFHT